MKINLFIYLLFINFVMSESIKEPDYKVISSYGNIEVREYSEHLIAKTSIPYNPDKENNNMFRTLAGYIFGGNSKNESIPMTAPVITRNNNNNYEMIFFMLNADTIDQLPLPNDEKVNIEVMNLSTTISIQFGMWATDDRVKHYKEILDEFIKKNDIIIKSNLMIAQYNSPWALPPFRKNELLYTIDYEKN